VHSTICQIPQAQIRLSLSHVPEPQLGQELSHGVPERGRVTGQPGAAGVVQVKAAFPARHWQIPSG
jgi:hypothetical protein